MKTREEIITSMCYTYRHDYGLVKEESDDTGMFSGIFSAGMTQAERESLWRTMAQIFDNDISPYMTFKTIDDAK